MRQSQGRVRRTSSKTKRLKRLCTFLDMANIVILLAIVVESGIESRVRGGPRLTALSRDEREKP